MCEERGLASLFFFHAHEQHTSLLHNSFYYTPPPPAEGFVNLFPSFSLMQTVVQISSTRQTCAQVAPQSQGQLQGLLHTECFSVPSTCITAAHAASPCRGRCTSSYITCTLSGFQPHASHSVLPFLPRERGMQLLHIPITVFVTGYRGPP